MAQTVWSGHVTFGLISIPIRISAAARSTGISFNMLHRDDLSRVNQQLICAAEKTVITRDETVKGYEYEKDRYIVIEPQEIKEIEPESSKTMEILEFVASDEVDPVYFDSSYHVTPELPGQKAYALVAKAMENSKYVAVAKWFAHNREYTVIIRPYRGGLMMHTMFYYDEVRQPDEHKMPVEAPKDEEVKMALQFFSALATEWEPEKYKDSFQESLQELIATKVAGQVPTKKEKKKKQQPVPDIMQAIRASLAAIEEKKQKKVKK